MVRLAAVEITHSLPLDNARYLGLSHPVDLPYQAANLGSKPLGLFFFIYIEFDFEVQVRSWHSSRSSIYGACRMELYFFFFEVLFREAFFLGIFAPAWRASLKAIATACLRLVTLRPLPDLSFPRLCSFITL